MKFGEQRIVKNIDNCHFKGVSTELSYNWHTNQGWLAENRYAGPVDQFETGRLTPG